MKLKPSSGRRRCVRSTSLRSPGGPQISGPVMRMAPKPRRLSRCLPSRNVGGITKAAGVGAGLATLPLPPSMSRYLLGNARAVLAQIILKGRVVGKIVNLIWVVVHIEKLNGAAGINNLLPVVRPHHFDETREIGGNSSNRITGISLVAQQIYTA